MRIIVLCFGILMAFSFSSLLAQELHDKVEERFIGVETVSVRGAFCKTEMVSGTVAEVVLEGEIRSVRRYQDLRIRYQQTGSLLDVWIEQPKNATGQIRGFLLLTVPARTKVQVSNLSGSIRVDGVGSRLTTLETISGDVVVKNHTDSLIVNSSSGSIQGDWIGGGVLAQSVSGNITMRNVKGGCQLTSSSGTIQVEEAVGVLDLTTISGSIKGKQLVLTDHASFKNASGDIDVMLSNDPETLRFDLKTLSGSLDVYGQKSDKQLQVGTGVVRITGKTSSGSQRYQ